MNPAAPWMAQAAGQMHPGFAYLQQQQQQHPTHAVQAHPYYSDPMYQQQQQALMAHAAPYMSSAMHGFASPVHTPFAAQPQPSPPSAAETGGAGAEDADVAHTPPTHGYAMLVGEHFRHILRSKHLQLGRHMGDANSAAQGRALGVSSAKNISRVHAELRYDESWMAPVARSPADAAAPASSGAWVLTCMGKNGLQHEGVYCAAHSRVALKHRDRVQIGDAAFYFLEPIPMSEQHVRQ